MASKWKTLRVGGPRGASIEARISPWFHPYAKVQGRWRTTLGRITARKAGIYMIKKEGGRMILYVGHSLSDLKKTLYRHFQSWDDRSQYRATYPRTGYLVRILVVPADLVQKVEMHLVQKLLPRDAEMKYTGQRSPGFTGLGPSLANTGDVPF